MISFEKITEETFKKILDMRLPPEQNFVAPNVVSLAQAWLYGDDARPFAITSDGVLVGFIMLDWDEKERELGIWRLMIAPEHQNKGYGTETVKKVVNDAVSSGLFNIVHLDVIPGNDRAEHIYEKCGFRFTGEYEGNEKVMIYTIKEKE